jgi:MFS family permease
MRLGEGLRDSAYRAALASAFANGWANFGVRVAIVPQFAVAVHDETWVAGVALAVAAAGTAASLQFSGKVTDTVGRKPMVVLGLGITAVSLGSLGLSESLAVLLVLSLVSGFGAGMVNPGQQATVADVIGNQRSGGTVLSTFQMAQDGGAIIGPVLIGVVADQAGWGWAFAVTGLVSLLALPLWLAARETLQKEPVAVTADQG